MPAPAVLLPAYDHPALEERYAHWQCEMILRREHSELAWYEGNESAASAAEQIEAEQVLVITDPLLLPSPGLGAGLVAALGEAFAAVPATNHAAEPRQVVSIPPYMTLREFEQRAAAQSGDSERVQWTTHDPGAFLARTSALRALRVPLREALHGHDAVIVRDTVVHRWASLRGQVRTDLLDRIDTTARNILEFGCGEAPLGAALKQRQKCRVAGVELDHAAAAIARKRIDDVYEGDVREIVSILNDRFDFIVGGDIVEHLDEPWTFLSDLRRISAPGGKLLLSLPNVAHASVIADLLQGRFDYVYMGLTCVGHLRFFTRRSLEEMLQIAGWDIVSIEPQSLAVTPEQSALVEGLRAAGVSVAENEIYPTGFYVIAANPA